MKQTKEKDCELDSSIWAHIFPRPETDEEKEMRLEREENRKYYKRCQYYLKKLGLEIYTIDDSPPSESASRRVEIVEGHEFYDELKEYWGINDGYVGLDTGEFDSRYRVHYEVLKECDAVIKKAKAKRKGGR